VEDISDKFAAFAVWFIFCFLITIILDAVFGMLPGQPFVDYGWIWFFKPLLWTIILVLVAMGKYKKHSDEAMRRKALEILKMKNEAIDKVLKMMCGLLAIGRPEEEIIKDILEEFRKDNVPEEWTQELLEAFKRKVEEDRSKKLKK
jgi:hypothetical protein